MTIEELAESLDIELIQDGNRWCARSPGFYNLQESDAGFGITKLAAMQDLNQIVPELDIFHNHSLQCSPHCRRQNYDL